MISLDISVAICTYNRADLLGGAIDSLCRQTLPANCFEIIVVDNGSTNSTVEIVRDFQVKYPEHNIQWHFECQLGLAHARNTAMLRAKGRHVAYLDDDSRAEPDWLAQALTILRKEPETLVCLGGPIQPFYTTPKPAWFKDEYESRSWGAQARRLNCGESFSGSNMIWRKTSLQSIGGFTGLLGVKGETLSIGEETDAFRRVWQRSDEPLLFYAPTLRVLHWVPPFKMKVLYRLKRAFVTGQVAVQMRRQPGWRWQLHSLLRGIREMLFFSYWAIRHSRQYESWQNWLVEEGETVMIKLGIVLASLGIFIQVKQK
jgi:glycosyltransferase involved in cell wall biosynthesis